MPHPGFLCSRACRKRRRSGVGALGGCRRHWPWSGRARRRRFRCPGMRRGVDALAGADAGRTTVCGTQQLASITGVAARTPAARVSTEINLHLRTTNARRTEGLPSPRYRRKSSPRHQEIGMRRSRSRRGAARCFQRLYGWAAVVTACPKTSFALVAWQHRPYLRTGTRHLYCILQAPEGHSPCSER